MFTLVLPTQNAQKDGSGIYKFVVDWNLLLDFSLPPTTVYKIHHSFESNVAIATNSFLTTTAGSDTLQPVIISCNLQTNGHCPAKNNTLTRNSPNNALTSPYAAGILNPINVAGSYVNQFDSTQSVYAFSANEIMFFSRNVYNQTPLYIYTYKKSGTDYVLSDCDGIHSFTFYPANN